MWLNQLSDLMKDVDRQALAKASSILRGNAVMFIGNGGSAAIASHMAVDYSKSRLIPAIAFNDPVALTCYSNDFGYENVFQKAIDFYGPAPEDVLVAISSSGQSQSILRGVKAARGWGCKVITLSGFRQVNPLRQLGDVNFYVLSSDYGHVEITHLAILHSIVSAK